MIEPAASSVLVTGGSDGIGLGLATRFHRAGATVVVTGRDNAKLQNAAKELPGMLCIQSDIGNAQQRTSLAARIRTEMPSINVVINNAGIQRRVTLAEDTASWSERQAEIDVLFSGPVHLNHLLIPLITAHRKSSVIANVTSAGGYIPQPFAPIYSACKAAIHSYTLNLRLSLSETACRVVEIIPPAVQTSLGGTKPHGADLESFCDAVFGQLLETRNEIGFGPTADLHFLEARKPLQAMFDERAKSSPVKVYG